MKKIALFLAILIVSVLTLGTFSACRDTETGDTEPSVEKTYVVEFNVQGNGNVYNDRRQIVKEGENTQIVVAMADLGYYFAGWSDDANENTDQTITWGQRIIENVRQDMSFCAIFKRITFQVSYVADENGTIEGTLIQSVPYGESTESVTAVANTGYRFVGWSDGLKNATRNEVDLLENKELTANFEIITNVYKYNYKFADGNCSEENVSLTYGQLSGVKLPVPTREHAVFVGWYSDYFLTQQVADENGNILVGDEFFYTDCTRLNAKWISENTRPFKVLIIYVTELNAEVRSSDGKYTAQINYSMAEVEKQICHMITEKVSFELNDFPVADFQVDEYFTTIPVTTDSIDEWFNTQSNTCDNDIFACDIPEVQSMLYQYDSILTSFSFNDFFGDFHNSAGRAGAKYGSVKFDELLGQLVLDRRPLEALYDPYSQYWGAIIDTYLHELAHTIELRMDFYEFHAVLRLVIDEWYKNPIIGEHDELREIRLYFQNKAVIDGVNVGIPYEYWEGKYAEVYYEATEGGKIYGRALVNTVRNPNDYSEYIMYGKDSQGVSAWPFAGYEFVEWSDGVKERWRKDTNITGDLHVYAIFAPIEK